MSPALLLVLAACGTPDDPGTAGDAWWYSDMLFAMGADLQDNDAAAISVAVMQDGEVTFAAAVGSRHPDMSDPITPSTLFQIGSITKQMTSVTALQKVDDGDLILDDTLADTIPDLEFSLDVTWSDDITLHDQLSHQSGLADLVPWASPATDDSELSAYTVGPFAQNEYRMNPPGLFFNYSNPNFSLAGLAAERQDTRAWPDVIEQDVFAPLGMDRTFARKAPVLDDGDVATGIGYRVPDFSWGTAELDSVPDHPWTRPAGMVWSSPTQMLSWASFLVHGDPAVLSDDLRAEVTTGHVPLRYGPGDADSAYGYGMFVSPGVFIDGDYYPMRVWDHGGNTLSYSAFLYVLPDQDAAISILISGFAASAGNTLFTAFDTAFDLPAPADTPPTYAWDPERLDDHVGTYLDPYNVGEIVITREGDGLKVSAPDIEAANLPVDPDLVPVSDTVFWVYVDGTPYDLTFIGEPGTPSQYIRNRIFVVTRASEEARTARPLVDPAFPALVPRPDATCPVSTALPCPP